MPYLEGYVGSTGARLISGNSVQHEQLEQTCADFWGVSKVSLFNSGFDANVAVFGTLPNKDAVVLIDEHIHASARYGVRLSGCQYFTFRHNDFEHLAELLSRWATSQNECWVGVEGVYSMDGDMPDARALKALKEKYNFQLIVDEAHSWGIYGHEGRGWCDEFCLAELCAVRVFPFGKSLGLFGAAVAGDYWLISYLQNRAPSFIFTTALPGSWAAHALRNLSLLQQAHEKRKWLFQLIQHTRSVLNTKNLTETQTAIQSIIVPGNEAVLHLAGQLCQNGYNVLGIRYPTVPIGSERIRIVLHSFNQIEEIDTLIRLIKEHCPAR